MADRNDALRKVRGLLAISAEGSGATEEERQSASEKAVDLRLRYGISDADLANAEVEDVELMGMRLFWYGKQVKPHLERIQAEVDAALKLIDKDPLQERARNYCRFYKDLHELVEGSTYFERLKSRRDAVVKAYFDELVEHDKQQHAEWVAEGLVSGEWEFDPQKLHNIFSTITVYTDLRRSTVERIVGISERGLWEKIHRDQLCEVCGQDGRGKRGYAGYDLETRRYVHEDCSV